jgi:hypothetical protein
MADRRRGKLGPSILRELTRLQEAGVPPAENIRDFYRRLRRPKPYSEEEFPDPPSDRDIDDSPPIELPDTLPGDEYQPPGPAPGPMLPGDLPFPDPIDPALPPPPLDRSAKPWDNGGLPTAFLPRESRSPARRSAHQLPGFAFHDSLLRTLGRAQRRKRKGSSEGSAARRRTPRAALVLLACQECQGQLDRFCHFAVLRCVRPELRANRILS